jgi:hypothetical protein
LRASSSRRRRTRPNLNGGTVRSDSVARSRSVQAARRYRPDINDDYMNASIGSGNAVATGGGGGGSLTAAGTARLTSDDDALLMDPYVLTATTPAIRLQIQRRIAAEQSGQLLPLPSRAPLSSPLRRSTIDGLHVDNAPALEVDPTLGRSINTSTSPSLSLSSTSTISVGIGMKNNKRVYGPVRPPPDMLVTTLSTPTVMGSGKRRTKRRIVPSSSTAND